MSFCSRMQAVAVAAVIIFPCKLHAQYLYNSEDPSFAHEKLVSDIKSDNVEYDNLGPDAVQSIRQFAPNIRNITQNKETKICQTLTVKMSSGKKFAFDSFHGETAISWVVNVSNSPEKVLNVSIFILPAGTKPGPPAMLPALGPEDKILPATSLGCGPSISMQAKQPDLESCRKWPEMCR